MKKEKDSVIWMGAGQIGLAIVRRIASGKKIIIGDKSMAHAQAAADLLNTTGFDAVAMETDLSSRESILSVIAEAQKYGNIKYLVNAAGVSPSQASVETILKVDLYGTAVLLEEVGKVIAEGGSGVTISSQSGHRMPALPPPKRTCCWQQHLLRSCFLWSYFSLNIFRIPCMPIRWPSAAM